MGRWIKTSWHPDPASKAEATGVLRAEWNKARQNRLNAERPARLRKRRAARMKRAGITLLEEVNEMSRELASEWLSCAYAVEKMS